MPQPSIQSLLRAQAERGPERRALGFQADAGGYAWWSREELETRAERLAAGLAGAGVGRGDVCLLVMTSGPLCATAIVAAVMLGALPLLVAPPVIQGVNSRLLEVLKTLIRRTRAPLVACEPSMEGLRAELAAVRRETRVLVGEPEILAAALGPAHRFYPATDDVAALQLTSGTTRAPRICVWKHKGVMAALDGMAAAMRLSETDDLCLNWTPLYHDMGLMNNFFLCLVKGVPLAILDPIAFVKRPALWLKGLSETGATLTWSPNFGYTLATERATEAELEGVRLDAMRGFWNAAERVHVDTMEAFHARFAARGVKRAALKTSFGCAENVGSATFTPPDEPFSWEWVDAELLESAGVARAHSAPGEAPAGRYVKVAGSGRPHPGVKVGIMSPRRRLLPDGRVGELALQTPSRLEGYLNDQRRSRRAIRDEWLLTGDLAYQRAGEIFWVGRVDERITIRGRKFDPSDFEPALFRVPELRQGCFVVFGAEDPERGTERLVIVSELKARHEPEAAQVAGSVRRQVMAEMGLMPDEVVLVRHGTLTKTSSGKRRHRHFARLHQAGALAAFQVFPAPAAP